MAWVCWLFLQALFGIGKEELDIDKLRNEIVKKCVRIDIQQNFSDDEKGRARNNIGAQVGDPGWYFAGGGGAGGIGYGGVIGAPIPSFSRARRMHYFISEPVYLQRRTTASPRSSARWKSTPAKTT